MKISSIVVLLLFAVWCAFCCYWWYPCEVVSQKESKFAGICSTDAAISTTTEEQPAVAAEITEKAKPTPDYLSFEWSSDEPILPEDFESEKNAYIAYLDEDSLNYIEIVGLYAAEELNSSSFPNLGLARAERLKALFNERLHAQLTTRSVPNNFENGSLIRAVLFNKKKQGVESVEVMSFADRIVLRFPSGSTDYSSSPVLESTLQAMAADMNDKGFALRIEGHTDNEGSSESNKALGLNRAEGVMNALVSYGANSERIEVLSFGEEKPIDTNETQEGKKNNRRVELIKLK